MGDEEAKQQQEQTLAESLQAFLTTEDEASGKTHRELIAEALVEAGESGNIPAIQEILKRLGDTHGDPEAPAPRSQEEAPKHPGGRPTKLTPELHNTIVNAVLRGGYLETAAAAAGVNQATLHRWLKIGARAGGGIQHQFSEAVKKAQASAELRLGDRIDLASLKEWQAAAWKLERMHPDRYGRREKLTIEMKVQEVKIQVYTVVIQEFIRLFDEANQLPEPETRRALVAAGLDRLVAAGFQKEGSSEES